jgi:hypothetical protein
MPNDDKKLTPKKIAQKIVQNTQGAANASSATENP